MDFQSAARFGTRRVMVTDYDETAVEVNAKVVDEDTGEVICESGGGGESDFSVANVTLQGEDAVNTRLPIIGTYGDPEPKNCAGVGQLLGTESITYKAILYKGKCISGLYDDNVIITVVSGDAVINDNMLIISGDCTINIEAPQSPSP